MAGKISKFDFWYALNNTEIVSLPTRRLETFGATILNYYVISELMDSVDRVRVREGRIQSHRPEIVIPGSPSFQQVLDGFGAESERFIDWVKENKIELHVLLYGFKLTKEEFSENILSDNIKAVTERVQAEVKRKNDAFSAIVRSVDDPWDVSLIRLMDEVIKKSMPGNVQDLRRKNLFGETDGVPNVIRYEIEEAFKAATMNHSLIKELSRKLEKYGLFEEYQDRFFSLVRSQKP